MANENNARVTNDDSSSMTDAELEMIDAIELIDGVDENDAVTSVSARSVAEGSAVSSRSSAPPPIPEAAKTGRRPSLSPPPPIGHAGGPLTEPPAASISGMFRIDRVEKNSGDSVPPRPSFVPPPPPGASEVSTLRRELVALSTQARDQNTQIHRLRLALQLRDDRVRDLEVQLQAACNRVRDLETQLAGARAVPGPDDLERINGIGPSYERALHALGVTTFVQIAAWDASEIERIATALRTTSKRILRDDWIGGARAILEAAGG